MATPGPNPKGPKRSRPGTTSMDMESLKAVIEDEEAPAASRRSALQETQRRQPVSLEDKMSSESMSPSEDQIDDKSEDNRKSKSKDQKGDRSDDDSSESAGKSEDKNSKSCKKDKMEIIESDKQDKDRRQGNKDKKDDDGDVC